MAKIELGKAGSQRVYLDLDLLLRTRLLVQANSGGGKSWLLRRLAEQLFGKVQVFLIDREGEFASLRQKYGYVLVGQGGDTAADVRSARLLAEKLLELRASSIFDLYEAFRARPGDRRAWVRGFLEAVVDAPKKYWRPLVVIVDEAHQLCPQETPKAASMVEREIISGCKDAMISLATVGRKRGFCAVWATQRLAKLDKDASAELFNRLVGMTIEDVDVDRACDLMSVSRDERQTFKHSLKTLEPGRFYAFGRAITNERLLLKVGPVVTTHAEPGSAKHAAEPPPAPSEVKAFLPKLSELPKEAETRARTEAELKAEVRALKAALAAKPKLSAPAAPKPVARPVVVERPVLRPADLVRLERAMAKCGHAAGSIAQSLGALRGFSDQIAKNVKVIEARQRVAEPRRTPIPSVTAVVREAMPPAENGNGLDKAGRAVLSVLAQFPDGCASGKLALLAGYRWSGGFRNTLSSLRTRGYLAGGNLETMTVTDAGREALGAYEPLPEGPALAQYWLRHPSLGSAERKALAVLLEHPDGLTGPELAEAAGYGWSGGFRNTLSSLRTAGVLVGKNLERMRPSPELIEV
jgi:hypothetical protein